MTSQEPSNPVVHRLVAAINDGDRDAFLATLTPHATLTATRGHSTTGSTARSSLHTVT
jgi:hypothetical protein